MMGRRGDSGSTRRAAAVGRLGFAWGLCLVLLVLAVPLGVRVGAGVAALRFLGAFLGGQALKFDSGPDPVQMPKPDPAAGRPPRREPVLLASGAAADLWRPRGAPPHLGVVLVHGLTPDGKDDPRLAGAAALLARGGLAVLVPDLPAMREQRLSPDDAAVVAAAIRRLATDPRVRGEGLVVIAVSVGTAPAAVALADSELDTRVRLVATLGGHAEARELVRYFTTGAWGFGTVAGRVDLDPSLARAFLTLNLDIVRDPVDRAAVAAGLSGRPLSPEVGPEARAVLAVLANRDPARVDALLAALPPGTQALLDALSPARQVRRLSSRVLIVHGREDPAIPFTESLRLAAAADPTRSRLVLVDLVGHVEGRLPAWRQARDLLRLLGGVYEVFRG
jgi:pimeloyl-ACP methyl ester carboxylesterase